VLTFINSKIADYFKYRHSHEQEDLSDDQASDSNKMPLDEVMNRWKESLDGPKEEQEAAVPPDAEDWMREDVNEELWDDEDEESKSLRLKAYRDFIFETPAYKWLLANLRRELLLVPTEPNIMESIRRKLTKYLSSSPKISRSTSIPTSRATFEVNWDPVAFVREQGYKEKTHEVIGMAITLTGSAKDAQALNCTQYMCQTWPSTGRHIIQLVRDLIRDRSANGCTCKSLRSRPCETLIVILCS
jgi:hypothetical protein